MHFPLEAFSAVSASNPWTYIVFGAIGYAFGFTLEMAGFGDSRKLAGQFYFRELTVFKVMFTAIAVAMVLIWGRWGWDGSISARSGSIPPIWARASLAD